MVPVPVPQVKKLRFVRFRFHNTGVRYLLLAPRQLQVEVPATAVHLQHLRGQILSALDHQEPRKDQQINLAEVGVVDTRFGSSGSVINWLLDTDPDSNNAKDNVYLKT
jgi:hypothetical protein